MVKIIDMHIHTTMSDGALTPFEVIDEAVKNEVNILSIADHDTIEAYSLDLINYAKNNNIELIPAVEISTKWSKVGIHVLGYNYDLNDEIFKQKLSLIRNARHDYLHNVAEKLAKIGYKLNVEKLDLIDAVTKAHIALDVIENKDNEEKLLSDFGHIPNKGEFIETIMNENCPAYVKKETVTPKQAAEIIRNAGGKVVLAHPVAYSYEDRLTKKDIQDIVDEIKPDGIEANYIYVDRNDNVINDISIWKEFAKTNNLVATIGSDFHNNDGIRPLIGFANNRVVLSENEIEELLDMIKK